MRMRQMWHVLFFVLFGFAAFPLFADTVPAVLTSAGSSANWRNTIGANQSATVGWSFSVGAQNIEVDALGVYDDSADGLLDAHNVGIWNTSGTLVAFATVPAGAAGTLVGSYRYTSISPLTLTAGQTYVIGTYFAPVADVCGSACGDVILYDGTENYDTRIAFAQSRQTLAVIGAGSLKFPDQDAGLAEGPFGPNFLLAADTAPDAFSFTSQAGVSLNATVTSNIITVTGIDVPTPISIVGGTYSINGGAYTSAAGSVSAGDTVSVEQVSSASYATLTEATLTIGSVQANFDAITLAAPVVASTVPAPMLAPLAWWMAIVLLMIVGALRSTRR